MPSCYYIAEGTKKNPRKLVTRDGKSFENKYFILTQPKSFGFLSRLKGTIIKDKYRIEYSPAKTTDTDTVVSQAESYQEIYIDWNYLVDKLTPQIEEKLLTTSESSFGEILKRVIGGDKGSSSSNGVVYRPGVSHNQADREKFESKLMAVKSGNDDKKDMNGIAENGKLVSGKPSGKTLLGYELYRTLGTGSFGRVMLAKDKTTSQYCAIKIIKKAVIIRLKQVEHTAHEKNILYCIDNPFVVKMYDYFQDKKCLYFALEYINGGEMFTHIHRNRHFSYDVAKFFAAEIILALEYLHNLDIMYRDLKPENILIDHQGHCRITDFGFAKRVTDKTWTLCGTPEYLAPEIILSKGYNHAVDWWAIGILMYEMRCGHAPFYDQNQMDMYKKIVEAKLSFPSHFKSDEKSIITGFLTRDLTSRLGNMRGKCKEIKSHGYFSKINFEALLTKDVTSPYIPRVSGPGDDSNFDKYDEEEIKWYTSGIDPHEEIFTKF